MCVYGIDYFWVYNKSIHGMNMFFKKFGSVIFISLFCVATFSAPLKSKGEVVLIITAIVGALTVVDAVSCDVNVIWGCDGGGMGVGGVGGGGVGGGGDPTPNPDACTSTPNGCGMTTEGSLEDGICNASPPPNSSCPSCTSTANACGQTNTGNVIGGTCNATTPPNAACPPPVFSNDPNNSSFSASPSTLGVGMSATLSWSVSNATDCDITSDAGFSSLNKPITGTMSTGPVLVTTTYTLTCENGDGGPRGSKTIKIIVDPHFKEL